MPKNTPSPQKAASASKLEELRELFKVEGWKVTPSNGGRFGTRYRGPLKPWDVVLCLDSEGVKIDAWFDVNGFRASAAGVGLGLLLRHECSAGTLLERVTRLRDEALMADAVRFAERLA